MHCPIKGMKGVTDKRDHIIIKKKAPKISSYEYTSNIKNKCMFSQYEGYD